jgi:hypothetical protein
MHARFKTLYNEGFHLTVQRPAILSLSVREQRFGSSVLFNKHVGVFTEHMLIVYYTKAAFALVNASLVDPLDLSSPKPSQLLLPGRSPHNPR